MHISEGVLDAPVLLGGGAAAALGVAIGLRRLDPERIPGVGILSATFFVSSLVHFPVGLGSVHLLLTGLMGILLGWVSFPAIFSALLLQALLFQFGGFTVLGVNTLIMALPAVLLGTIYRALPTAKGPRMTAAAAFLCGGGAVAGSALLMGVSLLLQGKEFQTVGHLVILAHLPLAVLEGFVTASAVSFLAKVKPEILEPAQ